MISLKLFGEMEVTRAGSRIELPGAKLAGLLAVLAAAGGKPLPRDSLADMLWGSHFDEQARQNLRQALSRLRKLLGTDLIAADDAFARLRPDMLTTDLARFDKLALATDMEALAEAVALSREPFLDGSAVREAGFADWLESERRRISVKRREVAHRLGQLHLADGEARAALGLAEELVSEDWLDEEAERLRFAALSALGRKGEALKAYQHFAEQLKRELGTAPAEPTRRLAEDLRSVAAPATPPLQQRLAIVEPSLMVLPFATPGGDPEQNYFAEGMVDEIITALSRLRWLKVLSRSSTFSARARGIDARTAGEEFGVRYVVEGSIRRAGAALRINGQLIDAATGTALWAESIDGSMDTVFDLQDRVAARVVGTLQPWLEQAEIARSTRKPTESLDAYDYYLRGLSHVHRWTREANAEALRHFYRAIELDGNFAAAYGMAARCYSQRKSSSWVEDEAFECAETERLANCAVAFGHDDPVALSAAGLALGFVLGRVSEGGELIERALQLNPGLAIAWLYGGWVKAWSGEADEAIARLTRSIELSPHDPNISSMRRAIAFSLFIAGRYQEAFDCAQSVATSSQNAGIGSATMVACADAMGRGDIARIELARLLQAEPNITLARLRIRFPIVRDDDFQRFASALARAGLPAGTPGDPQTAG